MQRACSVHAALHAACCGVSVACCMVHLRMLRVAPARSRAQDERRASAWPLCSRAARGAEAWPTGRARLPPDALVRPPSDSPSQAHPNRQRCPPPCVGAHRRACTAQQQRRAQRPPPQRRRRQPPCRCTPRPPRWRRRRRRRGGGGGGGGGEAWFDLRPDAGAGCWPPLRFGHRCPRDGGRVYCAWRRSCRFYKGAMTAPTSHGFGRPPARWRRQPPTDTSACTCASTRAWHVRVCACVRACARVDAGAVVLA